MNQNPERIVVAHPTTGEAVIIVRGESGYYPLPHAYDPIDELNTGLIGRPATPAETRAYICGSMFGWDCWGARVENYDQNGDPISRD